MNDILQKGVIAKVEVKYWPGLYYTSSKEIFEGEDISLGCGVVSQWPPEFKKKLSSLRTNIPRHLRDFSYTTQWGLFLPNSAYQGWVLGHNDFVSRLFVQRDIVVNNYEKIVEFNTTQSQIVARLLWKKNLKHPGSPSPKFYAHIADKVLRTIPDKNTLYHSFDVQVEMKIVPTLLHNQLTVDEIKDIVSVARDAENRQYLEDVIRRQFNERLIECCSRVVQTYDRKKRLTTMSIQGLWNRICSLQALNVLNLPEFDEKIEAVQEKINAVKDGKRDDRAIYLSVLDLIGVGRDKIP